MRLVSTDHVIQNFANLIHKLSSLVIKLNFHISMPKYNPIKELINSEGIFVLNRFCPEPFSKTVCTGNCKLNKQS